MSTGFDLQSVSELRRKPHLFRSGTLFTANEVEHCRSRPDPFASLAGLFSVKEALIKATGSLGGAPAYSFTDIEVTHGPAGQPRVHPHGRLGEWVRGHRLAIEVSISHTGDMAGAVVVLLRGEALREREERAPMWRNDPTPWLVEHRTRVPLRPNDFDRAGHLNNSVFPELMETGRWEWGLANGADLRDSPLVAVVLRLRLDYLQMVDWDPVGSLVVSTALTGRTAYSFSLGQEILRTDGTPVARGRVRLGLVHRETKAVHRADLPALLRPFEEIP